MKKEVATALLYFCFWKLEIDFLIFWKLEIDFLINFLNFLNFHHFIPSFSFTEIFTVMFIPRETRTNWKKQPRFFFLDLTTTGLELDTYGIETGSITPFLRLQNRARMHTLWHKMLLIYTILYHNFRFPWTVRTKTQIFNFP